MLDTPTRSQPRDDLLPGVTTLGGRDGAVEARFVGKHLLIELAAQGGHPGLDAQHFERLRFQLEQLVPCVCSDGRERRGDSLASTGRSEELKARLASLETLVASAPVSVNKPYDSR